MMIDSRYSWNNCFPQEEFEDRVAAMGGGPLGPAAAIQGYKPETYKRYVRQANTDRWLARNMVHPDTHPLPSNRDYTLVTWARWFSLKADRPHPDPNKSCFDKIDWGRAEGPIVVYKPSGRNRGQARMWKLPIQMTQEAREAIARDDWPRMSHGTNVHHLHSIHASPPHTTTTTNTHPHTHTFVVG